MILRSLTTLLLSTALYIAPVCGAASRQPNHQGQRPSATQNVGRPGAGARPQAGRPVNHGSHNQGVRPGARPGHDVHPGRRPGANVQPGRPNHGNGHGVHPGSGRPQPPHIGGHGHGHRPPHAVIPARPHAPFHRPVPPPSWRPVGRYPVLSTILGISFGTAIGLSVNALVADGYTVTGYGDNMVYLTNVPQLSMIWPDATLYYGADGGLMSSQFVYTTSYRDLNRFNIAYNRLVNLYGSPVDYNNASGNISATWFGRNGQFVSLTFAPQYTGSGALSFCTALSFGN